LVDNEAEAKKKEDKLLKQQQLYNLIQTRSSPSTPNLSILNVPPQEYTPISTILGNSSFSCQAMNFEGSIVAIRDYYCDNRTKIIKNRLTERKKGEGTRSKSSIEGF
jgi:hypothetical protein